MKSFNRTFLFFLLVFCVTIGAAQTAKKESAKSAKNSQASAAKSQTSKETAARKKEAKTSNQSQKKDETIAKTAKTKSEASVKDNKSKTEIALTEKTPSEDEKAIVESWQSLTNPFERIEKIKEFLKQYPRSPLQQRAQESLVAARAEYADELMRTGDPTGGREQFRLAVKDVPATISDKFFADVLSRIPANLFFRGEQAGALDAAKKIEGKIADKPERLIALAQFYLMIENSDETRRLATRAAELKPDSAAPQITLGLANRIGFRLEAASQAFRRALEIDPKSIAAKRGLADALRGLGQSEDAARLYREILQENAADEPARNGLVLSLFDAGNRQEAETEMNRAVEQNPKNFQLLATAAYWYAANKEAAKAVELGQKAVEIEPRYTWAHIALARGLINENKPLEAERALLIAKQYGNFPTLDYELASARAAAGFYEEAAADLRRHFRLKNGVLETNLAGRIRQEAQNFIDLLALERRASILQPASADTEAEAEQMKKLLAFSVSLNSEKKDETQIVAAAREFSSGDDALSVHRKLYAANKLLKEKIALPEVLELAQSATGGVDAGAQIASASAAVLAEELYEPRQLAAAQGSIVTVPDIGRNILTNILRGRIEEIAGWSLYNQDRADEAVVRLKRAVGILPEKSAWWRSSQWRLGTALEKAGKPREALEAYVKSYRGGAPEAARRAAIETLYVSINGTNSGLDVKLGETVAAQTSDRNSPPMAQPAVMKNPLPEIIAEINAPKIEPTPIPAPSLPPNSPPTIAPAPSETEIAATKSVEPEKAEVAPIVKTEPPSAPTGEAKEIVEPSANDSAVKIEAPIPAPPSENKPAAETNANDNQSAKTENAEIGKTAAPPTEIAASKTEITPPEENKEAAKKVGKFDDAAEQTTEISPVESEAAKEEPNRSETKSDSEKAAKAADAKSEAAVSAPLRVLLIDNLKNTVTEIPVQKTEKAEDSRSEPPKSEPPPETNPNVKITSTLETLPPTETIRPRLACAIWLNQTEVSVLSGGGVASLLVGIEGDTGKVEDLTATSENPGDIEIKLNKDVQISGNRALYEIRSLSENKGDFIVRFESNCGKKTVKVRVR